MDEFIVGLFTEEAANQPSDTKKEEQIELELPSWYDKKKFDDARKFFWHYSFMFVTSMILGLIGVMSVPSILTVLVHSGRSTTKYTAYKRYLSTTLHTVAWFENELVPGSISWKSLDSVRRRHVRASLSAKAKFNGLVSQRDLALTQLGFIGFTILKPNHFGIRAVNKEDWEAYNHFWRTIGFMIGIEDRYNICRKNVEETREVCRILMARVFTPCLENVPEYFEHMVKVLIEGMWSVNPTLDVKAMLYMSKHLADVPGYMYTEKERIEFQNKLRNLSENLPENTGIESNKLIQESAVEGLPAGNKLYYLHDYDVLETIPAYKSLSAYEKYKLNTKYLITLLYSTNLGRLYFNINFLWSLLLMKYCPYLAFFRFGVIASYVNIFKDSPKDLEATPKPNSYYENSKPVPWYLSWIYFFWSKY